MLEVWCPLSGLFQLVLGVPSKLTPDIVNKGLRIPEVLSEEGFELWPRDQSGALVAALVLSSSEADTATEEWGCKWGTIHLGGAWSFEMVLIMLTKVIAIHVRFLWIGLRGLALSGHFRGSACSRSQAWVDCTSAFINFVKRSLVEETRGRVGASRGVGASLLPASDLLAGPWRLTSSSCSHVGLVGGLLRGLRWARDPGAIAMELWSWFFQTGWLTH